MISVRQRELRRQLEQCERYLNTHTRLHEGLSEYAYVEAKRHFVIERLAEVQAEEYDPS